MIYYNIFDGDKRLEAARHVPHRAGIILSLGLHLCLVLALIVAGWRTTEAPAEPAPLEVVFVTEAAAEAASPPSDPAPPDVLPPDTPPPVPQKVQVAPPVEPPSPELPPSSPVTQIAPDVPPPKPRNEPRSVLGPAPRPAPRPAVVKPRATASAAPTTESSPAAPPPSALASPEVLSIWRGSLSAWLQSHKRYPAEARRRGDEGRVAVRFTVDRQGHVLEAVVAQSGGSAILDEAVLAMLRDAVVPEFPPGMTQERVTLTVQIRYSLQP
jgi:protein TonB